MYHFLVDNRGELHICPYEFEQDLAFLSENGYNTVGISDLLGFVYHGVPLPEKPVMLTFDDGYYNNYHYGFPLLQKYNHKAVIFMIAEHTDIWSANFYEDLEAGHFTWEQVREMMSSGLVEFGNHTYSMHHTHKGRNGASRNRDDGECEFDFKRIFKQDVMQFNERFYEETGFNVSSFAFPFHAVCDDAADVLQRAGYRAIFTYRGTNAVNKITQGEPQSLLNLYRINRSRFRNAETILQS
jgi:peptidoglycan/xylan/chitin deacetylase (PgdA/CDA1 family)